MPRINPTITDKAYAIYEKIPLKDKKHFVSDAIVEKSERDNGTSLYERIDKLEKKVEELRKAVEGK